MIKVLVADVTPLFNPDTFAKCVCLLCEERLKKVNKLRRTKDKALSAGGWLLLKKCAACIDENTDIVNIGVYQGGKPYFINSPHVHFSLSHSGTMAMCAVSTQNVGADIQNIRTFKDEICKRFFTPTECDYICESSSSEEKTDRFFEIWTLKEAYSKMTGGGIGEFSEFDVSEKGIAQMRCDKKVYFHTFAIPQYKLAVCTGFDGVVNFETVNIMDFIG